MVDIDGINYNLDGGQAYAWGFADGGFRKDLVIPSKVTYEGTDYPVYMVVVGAFENQDIETLVVSDGVEVLNEYSFTYCYLNLRIV